MLLSSCLVATLVASAHALPKGPKGGTAVRPREETPSPSASGLPDDIGINDPEINLPDLDDEDDEDDEGDDDDDDWGEIVDDAPEYLDDDKAYPNPIKTCPPDAKTKDNWVHYDVGEWFNLVAGAEEPYSKDIQETILSWGYTEDLYNFHCEPMQHCDATFDMEDCVEGSESTQRTYFILQAIINLNNFLTSLANAVDQTHGIVDGKAGTIVKTFSSVPDDLTVPSSPGVLTAGILGMVGSLLTGPAAIRAAMGGAMATTAVAIIGLMNDGLSVDLEPKFDDFADVTDYLADASATLQTALEDYARWVLTEVPENDRDNDIEYIKDQKALPYLLYNGDFAEPVPVDRLPDNLYASLYSGAITELWNKDQVFVVKIPSDHPYLDAPACEESGPFVSRRYCDEDGNSYVLLKYPELGSWVDRPWSEDGRAAWMDFYGYGQLGDYGLSIEAVAKGSENAFSRNDNQAGYEWDADKAAEFLMEDSDNLALFVTFNFPFCELSGEVAGDLDDWMVDDDDCDAECQIIYSVSHNCISSFPYDYTEQMHWEDEPSWAPKAYEHAGGCVPAGFAGGGDCDD